MILSRHRTHAGPRWFADNRALPAGLTLAGLLSVHRVEMNRLLTEGAPGGVAAGETMSPAENEHEVWAAGVTYLRSRDERQAESTVADVYGRVYEAERPELFFKALGWRSVGHEAKIRVRADSTWNVPEPELTLVVNAFGEIVGYTAGNDVSSRSIEGENPLYLPQAKSYDGSCALGPGIVLATEEALDDLPIRCVVSHGGAEAFRGETRTSQMRRKPKELVAFLTREMAFPGGVFLMTGTGIVPPPVFTLQAGDVVTVEIGDLRLSNSVAG
ncbi:MAG TPA: fumarylacetoacetate hydrolase family protein [Fimbriimonadaceae bacterium]|nr:fumarylacetoacetate hydrolase family protein [Fimbriimonadaceae bacterium]